MLLLAVLISMFSATDDLPEKWDYMLEYFPNGVYESISFTDYEEMGKSELYRLDKELRKDLEVPERLKGSIPKELSSRFIRVLSGRLMRLEINERKVHKIIKEVEEFVSGNDIKPGRAKYPKGSSEKEKRVIDSAMKKMAKSKSQFDETISAMFAGMSRIIVAEVADKEELLKILKEKALIKDVGKEKQLEGYDVYKLKKHRSKNASKAYFITFLGDGKTMLLVDYYPQMIAMLNAGVGNIEGIKERESFQTFLEMGLENLGQKFIVQFREESFVEFNIAQYLRKKMVPPEFMVKMMRDNYGKRSSIIDVSIRNYSNTYVDLRLFQFTNKAALDSDLSFRKKMMESESGSFKESRIYKNDFVLIEERTQDKEGIIKGVEKAKKFYSQSLKQEARKAKSKNNDN